MTPLGLLCALALASAALGIGGAPHHPSLSSRKLALIIAISEYGSPKHPVTGEHLRPYTPLNAHNDVPLVVGALRHQGFEAQDIRVLTDSVADAAGIRNGFRWLLGEAGPGDVVVFHYSGHGHRIGNDNPDRDEEVDGYDEVLAPYGAPDDFYVGYDGALHIRDDELGSFLASLRSNVGPEGNVTFFLDACYSGTGTRGPGSLPARGSPDPLGPPNPQVRSGGVSSEQAVIDLSPESARTRGGGDALAPFAVFSAAAQHQLAYETTDVDGETKVGSLSYALARTIPTAEAGTTNRALFARIANVLSAKVAQDPQMEGTGDAHLFSNRLVEQRPFVTVDSVLGGSGEVRLAAGSLLGLNPGTRLQVFPVGTVDPSSGVPMATLEVLDSDPVRSLAAVVEGRIDADGAGAWAFITEWTFGEMATRVLLSSNLSGADRTHLTRRFDSLGIVRVIEDAPDVVVYADRPGNPAAQTADGIVLGSGRMEVAAAVGGYARGQYMRRIDLASENVAVSLQLAPVETYSDASGRTQCRPADWTALAVDSEPATRRMSPGDAYRLRVTNIGRRRAHVALLDILPHGSIKVLRPRQGEAPGSYEMQSQDKVDLGCYAVDDELGLETLKVFATTVPQDFRGMFTGRSRGPRPGSLRLLGAIASPSPPTRSNEIGVPSGMATTATVHIQVVPR